MTEAIREYLNFTRKERIGIVILVIIIVVVATLPAFFQASGVGEDSLALAEFRKGVVVLERRQSHRLDSATGKLNYNERNSDGQSRFLAASYNDAGEARIAARSLVPTMFVFDPNTLDQQGWIRLGVREKTAATISRYLSKGGRFRRAEDLLKIYGLSEADKARLLPYVRVGLPAGHSITNAARVDAAPPDAAPGDGASADAARADAQRADAERLDAERRDATRPGGIPYRGQEAVHQEATKYTATTSSGRAFTQGFIRKSLHDIDINGADTTEWKTLPGIGSTLSLRIVKYREKLGGFYKADQVAEVFGLQDSVFVIIRPYLKCKPETGKIRVNEATPDRLEQHPYLKRLVARAIVDYRSQHGPFRQLEELRQLVVITPELFEKIAPYLSL